MRAVAAPAPPEGDGRGIHEMFVNPRRIFFKLVMFFLWYLALILVRSDGTASLPSGGAAPSECRRQAAGLAARAPTIVSRENSCELFIGRQSACHPDDVSE